MTPVAPSPDPLDYSRFARRLVEAEPALAAELDPAAGPWTRAAMLAFVGDCPDDALGARLRELRKRVMLRLLARDLAGAALEEICVAMTTLAEVAIGTGVARLAAQLEADHGVPTGESGEPQRLIVVGMGKLGGGELNVSSDIDLVFVYPEEGETRAPAGSSARMLSNHEFFVRLGRRLIALLGETTAQGWVFRVDMRLRPWGDPGPLATGFDALENYLVAQGRAWERYAWIKGRAVCAAGSDESPAAQALAALVRPFVFRRYNDYGSVQSMRELHAEVRAEVARRELADHVKLGPGGIREIEFIAQALQLIRGGRDAPLRERPTLLVLEHLAGRQLLTAKAVHELSEAYVFLRRLEHRIQYLDDAQTHDLPEDSGDRRRVARAMGYRDWRAFARALAAHRSKVSAHFERVFAASGSDRGESGARHALSDLWRGVAGDDAKSRLAALGFTDPGATEARLAAVRSGSRYNGLPEASRTRFDSLVPRLIECAAAVKTGPDAALERSLALMETIARRAAYLALLDEHPQALARLAGILGASSWAAEFLLRHPIVLDELLDSRVLAAAPDWNAFGRELRGAMMDADGDPERQMDRLREAHHAQVFRLLAQDLAGALSVEHLADHLSDAADTVLQVVLELCWTQLRNRHRNFPQFAVIGYGKLGGKELGYASDLDIIFLYDDDHPEAQEVYSRLAMRINSWLSSRTGAGILFETDLRLRPDGASGLLVSSTAAFRKYQRESAWAWEHQALTRARFCAGEAATGAAFEEERRHILRLPRDVLSLRAEVLEMRRKMLDAHPNDSGLFDIKHDRGGMIDIEFLVQYLVLANAGVHPELVANDGNIALLGMAAGLDLIPQKLAQQVQNAYREFRRQQHALRLNGAPYARLPQKDVARHVKATLGLWATVFGD